jgi:putative membrane protein
MGKAVHPKGWTAFFYFRPAMRFLGRLIMSAFALILSARILPGVTLFPEGGAESFFYALLVALVLGLLNAFVRPLLIFFTLPATIVTVGLFLWVINALLILLTDSLLSGFTVDDFWWALLFSLLYTLFMSIFERLTGERRPAR